MIKIIKEKFMELKSILFVFVSTLIFSACNFNYSESGKFINYEQDSVELQLAKKSLMFIEQQERDSLINLFDEKAMKATNQKNWDYLFENGKRLLDNNKYPNDSIITVAYINNKSISGTKVYKEFTFPFESDIESNTSEFFTILVMGNKIHKLFVHKRTYH